MRRKKNTIGLTSENEERPEVLKNFVSKYEKKYNVKMKKVEYNPTTREAIF